MVEPLVINSRCLQEGAIGRPVASSTPPWKHLIDGHANKNKINKNKPNWGRKLIEYTKDNCPELVKVGEID